MSRKKKEIPKYGTAGGKNADGLSAAVDKFVELAAL